LSHHLAVENGFISETKRVPKGTIVLLPGHGLKRPLFALSSFCLRYDFAGQVAEAGSAWLQEDQSSL
jgi:hypothetical protein